MPANDCTANEAFKELERFDKDIEEKRDMLIAEAKLCF